MNNIEHLRKTSPHITFTMSGPHCIGFMLILMFGMTRISTAFLKNDQEIYLVYSTAGGNHVRTYYEAGLYGGKFSQGESTNNIDLEQTYINRATLDSEYLKGFVVSGFSYDPVSKEALVLIYIGRGLSLAKIDPCQNGEITADKFYFEGMWDLQVGPFALYDSTVYFLARNARQENTSIILELTIRKVTGCLGKKNTFVGRDKSWKEKCTAHVAKVMDKVVLTVKPGKKWPKNRYSYVTKAVTTVGSKLLVVEQNDDLYFFVLIADPLETS